MKNSFIFLGFLYSFGCAMSCNAASDDQTPPLTGEVFANPPYSAVIGSSVWEISNAAASGTLIIINNWSSDNLMLSNNVNELAVRLLPNASVTIPCRPDDPKGSYKFADTAGYSTIIKIGCGESVLLRKVSD